MYVGIYVTLTTKFQPLSSRQPRGQMSSKLPALHWVILACPELVPLSWNSTRVLG